MARMGIIRRTRRLTTLLIVAVTAMAVLGAVSAQADPPLGTGTWNPGPTFEDQFSGTQLDASKWAPSWPTDVWHQCTDPAMVSVAEGSVHLKVEKKAATCGGAGGTYSVANVGGLITSDPIKVGPGLGFDYLYGYVEWRVYVGAVLGSNCPASLCMANTFDVWSLNQARSREFDVAEGLASDPPGQTAIRGVPCYRYHIWEGGNPELPAGEEENCVPTIGGGSWHTYALDWEPGVLKWYYDGKLVYTTPQSAAGSVPYMPNPNGTNERQYLMGEFLPPEPYVTGGYRTPLVPGTEAKIDYVKVWQHPSAPPPPAAPVVSPVSVTGIKEDGVTLSGSVNPQGVDGRYLFECGAGTGTNYDIVTSETYIPVTNVPVSATVGLEFEPDTTYHCRLSANNAGGVTTSPAQTFTTPPETVAQPFVPPNSTGELFSFGRVNGGLYGFKKTGTGLGAWSYTNLSSFGNPQIEGGVTPIETNPGELLVFGSSTSHDLYAFIRSGGASGTWSAYNVSANTPGNPKIYGKPSVIKTGLNEFLVFGRNANGELVTFIRASNGTWSGYNITANTPGNPHINGSPVVVEPNPGELLVFARNTNNELVSFIRASNGTWSLYNESAQVAGNPRLLSTPVPVKVNGGEFLVFGRTTNHELVTFIRASNGAWSSYNVSAAISGSPKLRGVPSVIEPLKGELLAFSRTTSGDLVGFIRSPVGVWSLYNVSGHISGNPRIHASPVAINRNGELQIYARSDADDLVSFLRSNTGVWSLYNISAQLTPKMK